MRQEETAMGPTSFIWRKIQLFIYFIWERVFNFKLWVTWYMSVIGILLEHSEAICQNANTSFTHFSKALRLMLLPTTHMTFPPTDKTDGQKGNFSLSCLHSGRSCPRTDCTQHQKREREKGPAVPRADAWQVQAQSCRWIPDHSQDKEGKEVWAASPTQFRAGRRGAEQALLFQRCS